MYLILNTCCSSNFGIKSTYAGEPCCVELSESGEAGGCKLELLIIGMAEVFFVLASLTVVKLKNDSEKPVLSFSLDC